MLFFLKSKGNNNKRNLISALLIAGVIFSFPANPFAIGQSTTDLQQQKDAKQKELQTI